MFLVLILYLSLFYLKIYYSSYAKLHNIYKVANMQEFGVRVIPTKPSQRRTWWVSSQSTEKLKKNVVSIIVIHYHVLRLSRLWHVANESIFRIEITYILQTTSKKAFTTVLHFFLGVCIMPLLQQLWTEPGGFFLLERLYLSGGRI